MSTTDLDPLLHMLGLTSTDRDAWKNPPYRNHYVSDGEDRRIAALIALRLVEEVERPGFLGADDRLYRATAEGIRVARIEHRRRHPPLNRDRRRYLHWLNVSDCYPDLKFGDWLRRRMYREVSRA